MKKADFILIGIILGIASFLLIILYGVNSRQGSFVQLEVDSEIIETLPLDEDTERIITTKNGEKNTLIIKDGKASIADADCPDKICVRHRAISRAGESIICLPHKLVVSITNNESTEDEIDAVA